MNNPSIQFYPGDWLRDHVSGCSLAAQGLWLRMLILMHDCERYGYLSTNGLPIPSEFIARKCGCDTLEQYETLLAELTHNGIPSRTSNGVIYSRRMVKDANERAKTKARVDKHRDKKKAETPNSQADCNGTCNGECNANCNGIVTPMKRPSSSSSSTSFKRDINISFSEFWDRYKKKRGSRDNCEKKWNKLSNSEREEIMQGLDSYANSFEDRQYQPNPETFLNQKRWQNEDFGKSPIPPVVPSKVNHKALYGELE